MSEFEDFVQLNINKRHSFLTGIHMKIISYSPKYKYAK
jgi:hypothetical protein